MRLACTSMEKRRCHCISFPHFYRLKVPCFHCFARLDVCRARAPFPNSGWQSSVLFRNFHNKTTTVTQWIGCVLVKVGPSSVAFSSPVYGPPRDGTAVGSGQERELLSWTAADNRAYCFTSVKRLGMRVIKALPILSGHFPVFHGQPSPLEPSRYNHYASTNVPLPSFTAKATGFFSPQRLRPAATSTAIKTQVFMFRYERVNSTRKFTIIAEIVSLLKKIYKGDAPF